MGGMRSKDGQKVYFFGIIDIFTLYGGKKKMEHLVKTISQGFGISCKPPDEYSKRFGQFLIKIFEVSEADLLCSSKLDQENGIPKEMMSEDGGDGKSERRKSCFSSKVMFSEDQSEKK